MKVSRDYLASVEAARLPLRYRHVSPIFAQDLLNPHWLAIGAGQMLERVPSPGVLVEKTAKSALFSSVYARLIKPQKHIPEDFDYISRRSARAHLENRAIDWLAFLKDEHITEFVSAIEREAARLIEGKKDSDERIILHRAELLEARTITAARTVSSRFAQIERLTERRNTVIMKSVRWTLEGLLDALRQSTDARGMKSELAQFMGVPVSRVSEWLSGVHEPSATATLKLLEWVTDVRVRNKNAPAGTTNTSKGERPAKKTPIK